MNKSLLPFGLALVFSALCVPALSMAVEQEAVDGAIVVTDSVSAKATVIDVKKETRELTLRDERGAEMTVEVDEQVRNFAQIKKGDVIEFEYVRAAATALDKMSDTNVASQVTDVTRAPEGAKPGMSAMQTSSIVATVLDVDTKKRLLTLQGPRGGIVTVTVPADMKTFDGLKKGDKISAILTEAIAISVKTPAGK